jgi:hypothetical protein
MVCTIVVLYWYVIIVEKWKKKLRFPESFQIKEKRTCLSQNKVKANTYVKIQHRKRNESLQYINCSAQ